MADILQILFSGLTVGAIYALIALGLIIIFNASSVVNFAQGEFVMLGGMGTVFLAYWGLPLPAAAAAAIVVAIACGLALQKLAIEPAQSSSTVSLIVITIGASIFVRGIAQIVFDKQSHSLPPLFSDAPLRIAGATVQIQSLVVMGSTAAILAALFVFFTRTLIGKAVLAAANNRDAARLVGIDTNFVVSLSFGLSAAVGALGGILVTPITLTNAEIGIPLALKGFAGAMLGGLGSPLGAVVGGLAIGLIEAITAGWISSAYKEASPFLVIILVLIFMPNGLFGRALQERV